MSDFDFSDFSYGAGGLDQGLKPRVKKASRIRVASMKDLKGFVRIGAETLIHKSDRDLWTLRQAEDGTYILERQFDETGEPLRG